MFLQSALKSRLQITSPSFLYFKTVQYSTKCVECSIIDRKNKAFDLVCAGSHCKQKSQKTLTEKLHCAAWSLWHCPYCDSFPSSVQSSSERLTKYRCGKKRTSMHPRKMPLYRHKAAVCDMHCHENGALCALNAHLQHRTDNTRNWTLPFCLASYFSCKFILGRDRYGYIKGNEWIKSLLKL